MFRAHHQRGWRVAIGLIVAYAFALQMFLISSMAAQAAAQGETGAYFICASHDDNAAPDDATVPAKAMAHCPLCTVSLFGATLPDPSMLPIARLSAVEPTPFVSTAACLAFHRARAGLTRAPPQNL